MPVVHLGGDSKEPKREGWGRDKEGGKASKGCINLLITALATGAQPV